MCGIFGVRGHPDAVALTKLGLFALQHRGQESAGIVAVDGGAARGVRSMGLVSDMPLAQLDALHGTLAIGHTRYSTAGSSTIENAQPVLVSSRGGHISLAHNGNITNAGELRPRRNGLGAMLQPFKQLGQHMGHCQTGFRGLWFCIVHERHLEVFAPNTSTWRFTACYA